MFHPLFHLVFDFSAGLKVSGSEDVSFDLSSGLSMWERLWAGKKWSRLPFEDDVVGGDDGGDGGGDEHVGDVVGRQEVEQVIVVIMIIIMIYFGIS